MIHRLWCKFYNNIYTKNSLFSSCNNVHYTVLIKLSFLYECSTNHPPYNCVVYIVTFLRDSSSCSSLQQYSIAAAFVVFFWLFKIHHPSGHGSTNRSGTSPAAVIHIFYWFNYCLYVPGHYRCAFLTKSWCFTSPTYGDHVLYLHVLYNYTYSIYTPSIDTCYTCCYCCHVWTHLLSILNNLYLFVLPITRWKYSCIE